MHTIIMFIDLLCTILIFSIIGRAVISWFPSVSPDNQFVKILYQITDPILNPLRRIIPPIGGTFDITPIAAIVLLNILQWWINSLV